MLAKNVLQTPGQWLRRQELFSPLALCLVLALSGALLLGIALGWSGKTAYALYGIGALTMILIVLARLDGLAVMVILAVHIYADWFLGLHLPGILMAILFLLVCYFGRSATRPWIEPRFLGLWGLFLIFTIYPAITGGRLRLYDLATFYPSIILGSFLFCCLGTLVARDARSFHRLLQWLALLATLLALHTIIEARLGVFLFNTQRVSDLLSQVNNYQLATSNATRAASFLIDPNWNGTLLAMVAFLPLGLFFATTSWPARALYLTEVLIILFALLFTYSNGGWVGLGAGLCLFILLSGRLSWSAITVSVIIAFVLVLLIFFPLSVKAQLLHASNPQEVILRVGIWKTALHTIEAFPLTGVGLGYQAYLLGSQPFSIYEQGLYSQPHDAYLELSAMAGIPVLILFLLLLFLIWRHALHNWLKAHPQTRALIACSLAASVSLSVSSITINGWTHPVMANVGWLLLGAISSPLLSKSFEQQPAPHAVPFPEKRGE